MAQWLRCCATNRKVAGSIPAGVIDIKSFRSYYGPGVDSASNANEYQEHFLGVKVARRMRWAGHVAHMGEESGAYRVLMRKQEGKRPLGRPRRGWVDNIGMDLQGLGCGYVDWIGLAQDRDRWRTLVSAIMNLRVP